MSKLHEKAQAQVKQMVGQMVGDEKLVLEGRQQQQRAEHPQETEKDQDPSPSSRKKARDTDKRARQDPGKAR